MIIEQLQARVNANRPLIRRGRWVTLTFLFGADDEDYLISIQNGAIAAISKKTLSTEVGVFSIRAARVTWLEHWQRYPKRDYHDIWSMLPKDLARLDGDILPLIQNLQYFKDVIASLRVRETT